MLLMNTRVAGCGLPFCKLAFPFRLNSGVSLVGCRKQFGSTAKVDDLKNAILNYYHSAQNFVQRRKEHEQAIKNYFKEYMEKGPIITSAQMEDIFLSAEEKNILNEDIKEINNFVQNKCNEKFEMTNNYVKSVVEKTELMKVLTICGIHIVPKILVFYLTEIILNLKRFLEIHKNNIVTYECRTKKNSYVRINNYYYDKEKVKVPFFLIFKSLSNVLYSLSENLMQKNEIYEYIKEEILKNYIPINDIINKAPSFLNISLLFFFINTWLLVDNDREIKTLCLDNMNKYINSISDDEINISADDIFYFILTIRLFFLTFSYNDVLNYLNNFSKNIISSLLCFPHNCEFPYNEQDEKYIYIANYMNKNDKYVELKNIKVHPFHFPLSSLKNKIIYILEKAEDYYVNDVNTLRAYNFWRYFIATRENYKLLTVCRKDEYSTLFTDDKQDSILVKYANKDYVYNFEETVNMHLKSDTKR
ncbi:conserved Plasmodium protein, unknown function [Plasmodium malariae]|uniref:Uncharacterized protein n=1 Tax=Plasmodium malariae TaxID=5858 RepID=A0A1C3KLQ2_PLAMA|nr:conserved Plasmodium protein, unknown function [Plasmodium malariae]